MFFVAAYWNWYWVIFNDMYNNPDHVNAYTNGYFKRSVRSVPSVPEFSEQNYVDMNLFPISNEEQLKSVELQINNVDFRNELVFKLSLLVDNDSLDTSVRRIIARLCDDNVLINYSLTGFKHTKSFANLNIYRVVIDAVRTNTQYSKVPDKKIDEPLKVWLDHSKFILQKKEKLQKSTL